MIRFLCLCSVLCIAACVAFGCDDTKPAPKEETPKTESPKVPLVEKQAVADWCKEHAVPESICTRCNASLIPAFQAKGDWCKEHVVPESQCIQCHPELEARFKAMQPKQRD